MIQRTCTWDAITLRELMVRRLDGRVFPSPAAEMVAHALASVAIRIDGDGLDAIADARLADLTHATNLPEAIVYDAMDQLVACRFAVNLDDDTPMDRDSIRYALSVGNLPCRVSAGAPWTAVREVWEVREAGLHRTWLLLGEHVHQVEGPDVLPAPDRAAMERLVDGTDGNP